MSHSSQPSTAAAHAASFTPHDGTLRPLRGPVLLACLLATLNHINNFTLPFVLFGAPAPDDVNVMPMIVYVTSFQSLRFGLSAAMAIVSLLIIAIPLFAYLRVLRLDVHDEGGRK